MEIESQLSKQALNRRYNKLQQLIKEDDFFSEENIKKIDPLLHFLYVGQYIHSGQQMSNFSDFLNRQMQNEEYNQKLKELKKDNPHYFSKKQKELTLIEQEDNEDELLRILHKKFIDGEYSEFFDYKNDIDQNEELDDMAQIDKDEEDKYFEEEMSDKDQKCTDLGILDF